MDSKDNHKPIIAQISYPNDPRNLSAKSWCSVPPQFLKWRIVRSAPRCIMCDERASVRICICFGFTLLCFFYRLIKLALHSRPFGSKTKIKGLARTGLSLAWRPLYVLIGSLYRLHLFLDRSECLSVVKPKLKRQTIH